jgi:hypothetical protein
MSMSHSVFSNRKLSSFADWQAAIDAEQLGVTLDASRPFDEIQGFLPARFEEHDSGFECDHCDGDLLIETLKDLTEQGFDVGGSWLHMLSFTYGSDARELRCAWLAGAAYAKVTGGVLFDGEEGKTYAADVVVAKAREVADPAGWAELDAYLATLR